MEELEGFEVFNGYRRRHKEHPEVTIKKGGEFSLNYKAYALLGEPQNAALLYNRDKRLIGIRVGGNIPVRHHTKQSTYTVAGRAFTKHYDIDTSAVQRYTVSLQDAMLIIDLNSSTAKAEDTPQ